MAPLNLSRLPAIPRRSSSVSFDQCFLRCPSSCSQLCVNCSVFMTSSSIFRPSFPCAMALAHMLDPKTLFDVPFDIMGNLNDLQCSRRSIGFGPQLFHDLDKLQLVASNEPASSVA